MLKAEILIEINKIFKKIIVKTESIEKDNDSFSRLEFDIIMADIRNLYEYYNKLSSFINTDIMPVKEPEKPAKKKEPKEKEAPVIIKKEEQAPELIENFNEEVNISIQEITQSKVTVTETKQVKTTTSDLFSLEETNRIVDKFHDDKQSINEKIALNKPDISIADKLKSSQSGDIKTLIGINEKYLFINELFEGNTGEYNEFIAQLNQFTTKNEANSFISNLKSQKGWKDNIDSMDMLEELVNSRYSE